MIDIKPAIISADFNEVKQKVEDLETLVKTVHIDVADGLFTSLTTHYTPDDLYDLPGRIKLEAHLMISEPEDLLRAWTTAVDRIVVHLEAVKDLETVIEALKPYHTKLGVAVLLDTPLTDLVPYLNQIDLIQLMAIAEIGKQGEILDQKIYQKIKSLRSRFTGQIQIDGGVTLDNASELIEAGADSLVVGSAIWQAPDYVKAIENFHNLAN